MLMPQQWQQSGSHTKVSSVNQSVNIGSYLQTREGGQTFVFMQE